MATVAAVEWRQLRADRGIHIVGVLFALATVYALWNGQSWTRFQQEAIRTAAAEEADRFGRLPTTLAEAAGDTSALRPFGDARHPYAAGNGVARRYVAMPAPPLGSLAVGQSDLYPAYHRVSFLARETFHVNDELESPSNLLSGRFDLAFVMVYLLPLLVLALGYNILSAEREQGTLAMLLAQPLSPRTLLVAKIGVRVGLVLLVGVVLPLLVAALFGVGAGAAAGLMEWTALVAAYALFWFAVALLIAGLGRGSSANALTLLGVWLVLVVLVPATLNVVAVSRYPVPSRVGLITAERSATREAEQRGAELLGLYYQDHPELAPALNGRVGAPAPDFAATRLAVLTEVRDAVASVAAGYDAQRAAQRQLVGRWRFLSPAVLLNAALQDVAGTGDARYAQFQLSVDRYMGELRAFYEPRIFRRAALVGPDIALIPTFTMVEEPASAVARRVRLGLVWLMALTAGVGLLGLVVASRRTGVVL